jgi:hypothetical protein
VDYALSDPIPWKAPECSREVHLGGTIDEIAASEEAVREGRHSNRPFVILVQSTLSSMGRVREQADRAYWEKKADPASLAVVDKIVAALKTDNVEPRLTYNRYHIALGTKGYNFCWFHPRKTAGHCHIEFRATSETRGSIVSSLQEGGIDASPRRTENVTFSVTSKDLEEHFAIIRDVLKRAEETSRL